MKIGTVMARFIICLLGITLIWALVFLIPYRAPMGIKAGLFAISVLDICLLGWPWVAKAAHEDNDDT